MSGSSVELTKPRPPSLHRCSTATFRGLMCSDMTDERYDEFKNFVYLNAKLYIDEKLPVSKQNQHRWAKFRSQALTAFPELERFEGNWPLEVQYRIFHTAILQRQRYKSASARGALLHLQSPRVTPLSSSRGKPYVGKPLPPVIRFTGNPSNNTINSCAVHPRLAGTLTPSCTPHSSGSTSNIEILHQHPSSEISSSSCYPKRIGHRTFDSDSRLPGFQVVSRYGRKSTVTYPVPCLKCEHLPVVPPQANSKICAVLHGRKNMVLILASLGVVSDHHLHLLKTLLSVKDFLDPLAQHVISPFRKQILKQYLSADTGCRPTQTESSPRHMSTVSSSTPEPLFFLRPSSDAVNAITRSASQEAIQKAMGLESDPEHYWELINTIENNKKELYPPNGTQEDWGSFVDKICSEYPSLKNYEDCWPVEVYVRWCRTQRPHIRITESVDLENNVVPPNISGSQRREWFEVLMGNNGADTQFKVLRLPSSGCLIHPLPSEHGKPVRLLSHLRDLGLEELLPVFDEIESDEDYDMFCSLDEDMRRSVLQTDFRHLKIRPFQDVMLDILIKSFKA